MTRRYWGLAAVASILAGLPLGFLSLAHAMNSPVVAALITP